VIGFFKDHLLLFPLNIIFERDSIKGDSDMGKKTSIFSLIFIMIILAVNLHGQDIHTEAKKGDLAAVKAILEEDPEQIETLNASNSTPLIVAASNGHVPVIEFLLERGADIQAVNTWGRTPLHYAVDGGYADAVMLLLEKGADINGHKDFPFTPLHIASGNGDEEIVDLLLARGAGVNILSSSGTPLHRAVNSGSANIIHLLLAAGADINAVNPSSGWTPLHTAASSGMYEAAKILVENGINLNAADKRGATALFYAIYSGDRESEKVAILLLKKGAEFNTAALDGSTPLLIAVQKGKDEAVELLLDKGAETGPKEKSTERSMLHLAAIHGYGNIAEHLIGKGIDIYAQDKFGRTALDYAERHGNQKVAEYIYAAGGKSGANEKNFGHSRYLEESLSLGEAYIWKLASFGWVVKTKNHLFVFNNEEHSKRPDEPLLANGFISASELTDQNIFAVYPAYHAEAYAKEFIHAIEDSLKNITYIYFKEVQLQGVTNTVRLGGQGTIAIQDVSFSYAEEQDEGGMGWLNYLIEADGLTIYYSGFLGAPLKINKKHIENMAKGGRICDVAFLLLAGRGENTDYIDQVVSILKPKVIFLHMALSSPSEKMIETFREKYPAVKFYWASDPGERFRIKR
jgi:ankyrin repeat protein